MDGIWAAAKNVERRNALTTINRVRIEVKNVELYWQELESIVDKKERGSECAAGRAAAFEEFRGLLKRLVAAKQGPIGSRILPTAYGVTVMVCAR